jgi:O-antigen ligase
VTHPAAGGPARGSLLPRAWPVLLLFALYPVWWLLGLGGFIWPILAIPMLLKVLRQGRIKVPPGFGIWLLFLAWMLASLLEINEGTRLMVALHRASLYASATVLFVYVYNLSTGSSQRIVWVLALFWSAVVGIGLLAVFFPSLEFHSITERLLPKGLLTSGYVQDLTTVRLAQIHSFLGFPVGRPTGPFTYTNEWGSAMALLTPFAILAFSLRLRPWRSAVPLLGLVGIVPLIVSLDRGAWLSLGLGMVYAMFRMAVRARLAGAARILISLGVVLFLVMVTPLGGLLQERIETPHSNKGRLEIYGQVIQSVRQSPLFGFGGPREAEGPYLPQLGTQGAFWLVLYSHGIPGAVLFVGFLLIAFWRSRTARPLIQFWSHIVLFIGIVQLPYYGMLPAGIHILMAAAAVGLRSDDPSYLVPAEARGDLLPAQQ